MKLATKMTYGLITLLATLSLTACPGGGGGDPGPAAGAAAITGTNGSGGYVGSGSWTGNLVVVNNPTLVQQFMYQIGGGGYITGYIQVAFTNANAFLPPNGAPINFSIGAGGGYGQTMQGCAFANAGNNGFVINYYYGGYSMCGYGYNNYPYAPGYPNVQPQPTTTIQPLMQITAQFTDNTHQVMNAQVVYQGQQIATGQIFGYGNNYGNGGYGYGYGYGTPYGYNRPF